MLGGFSLGVGINKLAAFFCAPMPRNPHVYASLNYLTRLNIAFLTDFEGGLFKFFAPPEFTKFSR